MSDLVFRNVQPAQPIGFIVARPKGGIALPEALHLATRLPIANGSLHRRSETLWQRRLQTAHAVFPFCCVFFSTAASNCWKASANNFTPSAVSFVVTSLIDMPA